jgi:hypothetical protein
MLRLPIAWTMIVGLGACGPSVATTPDDHDDELGAQPMEPGSMYSPCESVSMCHPLEFCVYPRGHDGEPEAGFCAGACGAGGDASVCDPAPGTAAWESCLDIGLGDGREVCALDCGRGRTCPAGMRCEGLRTPSGERYICF